MASEENIKVAVRLRPFIPEIQEEAEGKAKRIIRMDELSSSISITNPENRLDVQQFTFDNILWSFDGYSEQSDGYLAPDNKAVSEELYCDQKQVYEEVGKEVVQNLWNGYNSTIFTFGESKSGKSWTLFGQGANKGIIPQSLTEIFKGVREKEKSSQQQNGCPPEVRISMCEIYNEKIKDLLPSQQSASSSSTTNANLAKLKCNAKIREHSRKGFYVEGLRSVLVVNHEDIQQRLEEGLVNRAIFLTSVNATVENSMTVVSLTLVQKMRNHRGDETTRLSTLEFIDLPSCQFVSAMDDADELGHQDYVSRYPGLVKNGIDSLANCIESIVEASLGKQSDSIAFHKHPVTKLMKNALVGNCKSFLILTLSPSELSYRTSKFALKLAEKIKMITTHPTLNEEVTSKLMRELKGENEKLRRLISNGDFESNQFSNLIEDFNFTSSPSQREHLKRKIVEEMKAQIRENEREIKGLQQPLEDRYKPFKMEKNDVGKKIENDRKNKCHVFNLSGDTQVSGRIIHIIPLGTCDFGSGSNGTTKGKENFINFCGTGIREHHGSFTYNIKDGKFSIRPAGPNCKIFVNEELIQFETALGNNDRIGLGGNQIWLFQNPKEAWLEKYAFSYKLHYDYIQHELATRSKYYKMINGHDLTHQSKCQVKLITSIENAESMMEDLDQNYIICPVIQHPIESLLSTKATSSTSNSIMEKNTSYSDMLTDENAEESDLLPNILIKVQNSVDGTFRYWSIDKFHEKLEMLKGSYMQFLEDGDTPLKELEAFKENSEKDVPIGYSVVSLKPLAYLMNYENSSLPILDYISFQQIGSLNFSLCLCEDSSSGKILNDLDIFVENSEELLDQNLTLMMRVSDLESINYRFKEIYCKYKFLDDNEEVTKLLDSKTPTFITGLGNKYERRICIGPINDNILNMMLTQNLVFRFFGKQRAQKLLNLEETLHNELPHWDKNRFPNPIELERTMTQLKIKEKSEQRHKRKLLGFKALVEQSELLGEESIPVSFMKDLFQAKNQKLMEESLEEHKELLTPIPEESMERQLPPELKALKRFSEICNIC